MTHHFLSLAPDTSTTSLAADEADPALAAACKVNNKTEAAAGDGGSIPDLNVASVEEEEQPQPQPQPQAEAELQKGFGSASSSSWQRQTTTSRTSTSTKVVVEPPDWLPQGWIAEVRTREGGTKDKYYFEPVSGRRFRSKLEVLKYLEASKWRADDAANGALLPCAHATKSPATSLKEAADRLPFLMQSGLDDLRNILAKGPPPLPSPGFHEYWNSSSGGRSSWTDYFKLNTSAGGGGDSSNGASSSLLHTASGTTSATPHWLDRILNKGPPLQPPPPSSSGGTTDGFVQSPLHYLHNAGAFHNSWLHIKPPTQNTTTSYCAGGDAPWKPSWSRLEAAAVKPKSKLWDDRRPAADSKRPEINLNQAFDPDDEDCWPDARALESKADQPDGGRALESLWDRAVPITLEHREFRISSHPNGCTSAAAAAAVQPPHPQQHNHQQQQQGQQHRLSKEGVHFDVLGVRRTSQNKLDRHQEKKRMENLGKTLCKQSGARLLLELKETSSRLSSIRQ